MCAVSMVTGHFHEQYPQYTTFPPALYPAYAELVRKAKLYDEMTKQPDCPDPANLEWHKALEDFMREKYGLEAKKA